MGNSCSTIHESRGEYYYRRREQYLQNNRRDLIRPQIHHEILQWTRTRRTVKYNKKCWLNETCLDILHYIYAR
jgi:hypothetical protein